MHYFLDHALFQITWNLKDWSGNGTVSHQYCDIITGDVAYHGGSGCSRVSLSPQASTLACTGDKKTVFHHQFSMGGRDLTSILRSPPVVAMGKKKKKSFLHSCKIRSPRNKAVETPFLQLTLLVFLSFSASLLLPSALESRSVRGGGVPVVAAPLTKRLGTITALQLHSRTQQPLHSTGKKRNKTHMIQDFMFSDAHTDDLVLTSDCLSSCARCKRALYLVSSSGSEM